MRILVIEDNEDLAANIIDFLSARHHVMDSASDGVTGLHLAVVNDYDAIVLDLMLPGIDGFDLCTRLRGEADRQTPVLMLTARDTLDDKAQLQLARLYYQGERTEQSFEKALQWFRAAAEQGSAEGQFNLGVMTERGEGTEASAAEVDQLICGCVGPPYDQANVGRQRLAIPDGRGQPALDAAGQRGTGEHAQARGVMRRRRGRVLPRARHR